MLPKLCEINIFTNKFQIIDSNFHLVHKTIFNFSKINFKIRVRFIQLRKTCSIARQEKVAVGRIFFSPL